MVWVLGWVLGWVVGRPSIGTLAGTSIRTFAVSLLVVETGKAEVEAGKVATGKVEAGKVEAGK